MIPKIIHYCWFGGAEKNSTIRRCIDSWSRIMPDYSIVEWNETNLPIMGLRLIKKAYKKTYWNFISDISRLWILYEFGGIYLDTDVEVIKRFDPLLDNSCFLGFQQRQYYPYQYNVNNVILSLCKNHPLLGALRRLTYGILPNRHIFLLSTDWINNAIMGSIPRHTFLKRCYHETIKRYSRSGEFYRGPEVSSDVLRKMGLRKYGDQLIQDIKLYPCEYFSPYPHWGIFRPECVKKNTYCIHHWQLSWF